MITLIEPERGGESQGILRVEISLPLSPDELVSLGQWFEDHGWPLEADQITSYVNGEDYR